MDSRKRLAWFQIVIAFTAMPAILTATKASETARTSDPDPTSQTLFQILSILALGAAVIWCVTKLRLKGEIGGAVEVPAFPRFQSNSLIGLAFSELSSIAAFATPGSTWQTMLPYLAGTLVVNLLFVLPAGLAYFRALAEQDPNAPG